MNRCSAWGEIGSTAGGLQLTPCKPDMAGDSASTTDSGLRSLDQPGHLSEKPGKTILRVVSHRLAESGAHGIPNIQRAKSSFRRLAWTVLFLAGLGMFVYQGCDLIIKYYNYPYNVNIEVRTLKKAEFPAVTMCNLNPIRRDALEDNSDLCNLLAGSSPVCNPERPNVSSQQFTGYPSDWNATEMELDYSAEDSTYETQDTATEIVGALPYNDRGTTGHQLNDMLLECTFQRKHCSPRNFTSFYNARYGNCFTFNSGVKPLRVTKTGPSYGLSMELYIQQDQYITGVETGAGIRILVHNQTDMPFPEDDGAANVSPGTETFIGLYRILTNRLALPYGECATYFADGNIFKQKFSHLEYTKNACENNCYFMEVLRECKCADVRYRYNDSQPACNSTNEKTESCIEGAEERFLNGTLNCRHCLVNCNETRYELSYSVSSWPNRRYLDTVRENIGKFNKDTAKLMDKNKFFIKENVLRVNIYYDDLNYNEIYQSPAYTVGSMVSDLGGQIGLWIGVSVLTVCEFVELLLDICLLIMVRCRAGGERSGEMTSKVDRVRPQS